MSIPQPSIDVDQLARSLEIRKRRQEVNNKLRRMQLTDCLPQLQSPLFKILPENVRHTIFSYSLEEQDGKTAIGLQEYFYRPDYTHYPFINTALLMVCRQIYLEARVLLRQNIIYREWYDSRCPPTNNTMLWRFLKRDKTNDCARYRSISRPKYIQFFTPMDNLAFLDRVYDVLFLIQVKRASHVVITIRYIDWANWETDQINESLELTKSIVQTRLWPECVDTLDLELETRYGRRKLLDSAAGKVKRWILKLGEEPRSERRRPRSPSLPEDDADSSHDKSGLEIKNTTNAESQDAGTFPHDEEFAEDISPLEDGDETEMVSVSTGAPVVSNWVGSAIINGVRYKHHDQSLNGTKDLADDKMMFHVVKATWKKMSVAQYKQKAWIKHNMERLTRYPDGIDVSQASFPETRI